MDSGSGPPASSSSSESSIEGLSTLSPTAALAKEAASLFQSNRYQECLDALHRLSPKENDDPKVLHNIAISEYFRDGCTDPQKLLDVLSKVKKRSEELARTAGEQLDAINASLSSPPSTSTSGSRGSNSSSAGAGLSPDAVIYMEHYDSFIPTLNTAVILYHLQQYGAALSVLEPLYRNIEPIDEPAALQICLLMLDITSASRQLRKAAIADLPIHQAAVAIRRRGTLLPQKRPRPLFRRKKGTVPTTTTPSAPRVPRVDITTFYRTTPDGDEFLQLPDEDDDIIRL